MTRLIATAVAVLLMPLCTDAAERARYLMGTVCTIEAASDRAIDRAFDEAARIEAMLSTWRKDSELGRYNRGEDSISDELRALLASTSNWSSRTGGAFDPRVAGLVSVWGVRRGGVEPSAEDLFRTLEERDALRVAGTLRQIDEGGFGKGYALDRMLALLDGPAMIDFGGQLVVRGSREVAIASPMDRSHPVISFTLADASLSTSSGSETTFVGHSGTTYSHLIDPRSGRALPPRGSVSVIVTSAFEADVLSTALYVMGEEQALEWAAAHGVAAIIINSTREVRLSAAARERARDLMLLDPTFTIRKD